MRTQSPVKLPTYQTMGRTLRINFNEQVVSSAGQDGESRTAYVYRTAVVDKLAARDSIIEAIIAATYPTYGAELAALQSEPAAHAEVRLQAKELASLVTT